MTNSTMIAFRNDQILVSLKLLNSFKMSLLESVHSNHEDYFTKLPIELLVDIATKFLSYDDVVHLSQVCKSFYQIFSQSDIVWKHLHQRDLSEYRFPKSGNYKEGFQMFVEEWNSFGLRFNFMLKHGYEKLLDNFIDSFVDTFDPDKDDVDDVDDNIDNIDNESAPAKIPILGTDDHDNDGDGADNDNDNNDADNDANADDNANNVFTFGTVTNNLYNEALKIVALNGYPELVEWMIDLGADDYSGACEEAAIGGHLNIIRFIMDFDWAPTDHDYDNIMATAARHGHHKIVNYALRHGATKYNWALAQAAEGEHETVVNEMLNRGANNYNWAMVCAAKGGHQNIVTQMLNLGANNYNGALVMAASNCHPDIVTQMINRLLDQTLTSGLHSLTSELPQERIHYLKALLFSIRGIYNYEGDDFAGYSLYGSSSNEIYLQGLFHSNNLYIYYDPIKRAAARQIIIQLIDLGTKNGCETCCDIGLVWASYEGDQTIFRQMINLGATSYNEALEMAAWKGHHEIIVQLLSLGVARGTSFSRHRSPETYVHHEIDLAAESRWLRNHPMVNQKHGSFNDVLARAAEGGHQKIVDQFLQLGATNYNRALKMAALEGHSEIVNQMLKLGATNYNEALMAAVIGGHGDIAIQMLQLGATDYKQAQSMASSMNHKEVSYQLRHYTVT